MPPWHIDTVDGSYCIVDDLTTEVVPDGHHGSDAGAAVNHLKALYAAGPAIVTAALAASAAAPLAPPADWFDVDEPDGPEPLTIETDGRVHGHLALWDACHVGFMQGSLSECVKPPRSPGRYESFHLGQMIADDGSKIAVGKVVYGGPHASLTAGLVQAREHYDRTSSVGAFVRARDGRYGIFLAGAARSDISPEGLRDMRANPPSGDWRRLRGSLELVAALAVGIPGYQTPQVALTASGGDVEALILPGYTELEEAVPVERGPSFVRQKRAIQASINGGNRPAVGFDPKAIAALVKEYHFDEWESWAAMMTESVLRDEGCTIPWSSYPDNSITASPDPNQWTANWDGAICYPMWITAKMDALSAKLAGSDRSVSPPNLFDGLEVVIHEAEHFSLGNERSSAVQGQYQIVTGEYWEEILTETVARLRTTAVAESLGFAIPHPMGEEWALYQKYMPWVEEHIVGPMMEAGLPFAGVADELSSVHSQNTTWRTRISALNEVLAGLDIPTISVAVAVAQGELAKDWDR